MNSVCPENHLLGRTGVREMTERLSSGDWSGTVGHSQCAWCGLLGNVCLSSPKRMCMYIHYQTSSRTSHCIGDPGSQQGYQVGRMPLSVFRGDPQVCDACGTSVWMCVCFLANTKPDQSLRLISIMTTTPSPIGSWYNSVKRVIHLLKIKEVLKCFHNLRPKNLSGVY